MLARDADSVAAHLFELMVSGRGCNMASDSDYADGKYGHGMMLTQVLRDFLDKELFYYAYLSGLTAPPRHSLQDFTSDTLPGRGSMEMIVKSFLAQIQVRLGDITVE